MYFQLKASKGLLFRTRCSVSATETGLTIQNGDDMLSIAVGDIINIYRSDNSMVVDYYAKPRKEMQYRLDDKLFDGGLIPRMNALLETEWFFIKNAKQLTSTRRWLNMAVAPYYLAADNDISTYAGMMPTDQNMADKKARIQNKWKVTGRAELLAMLEALLDGYYTRQDENNKDTLYAWDLVSTILLSSEGYIAGYLRIEEASSWGLKAARKLQQVYGGWQEIYEAYMASYLSMTGEDPEDQESFAYAQTRAIRRLLKGTVGGLNRVDWNAPLRADWHE